MDDVEDVNDSEEGETRSRKKDSEVCGYEVCKCEVRVDRSKCESNVSQM